MLGNDDALAAFATGRRSRHQFARDLFGLVGEKIHRYLANRTGDENSDHIYIGGSDAQFGFGVGWCVDTH